MKIHDIGSGKGSVNPNPLRYFQSTLILALVAFLLVGVSVLFTIRFQKITAEQVGVKINNITGEIEIVQQEGTNPYNGILSSFYVIDSRLQTLVMVENPNRGDRQGKDDLRIKTIDGSNVYLDLTINYKMMPDEKSVKNLLQTSGLGNEYKYKWMRDFSRSICRAVFGEMTTEQFYDASIRSDKARQAREELNKKLEPFGIHVETVIADKFRFPKQYEAKIIAKKNADQEVERQKSEANAANEKQKFRIVEATKQKEVSIVQFKGEMKKKLVAAVADADKRVKNAEAYAYRTSLGADAEYEIKEKNAQAILAQRTAEAEGVKKMAQALEGEGGVNIVKLEYAKRLNNLTFTGKPYTINAETERFSHVQEAGASVKRSPRKANK